MAELTYDPKRDAYITPAGAVWEVQYKNGERYIAVQKKKSKDPSPIKSVSRFNPDNLQQMQRLLKMTEARGEAGRGAYKVLSRKETGKRQRAIQQDVRRIKSKRAKERQETQRQKVMSKAGLTEGQKKDAIWVSPEDYKRASEQGSVEARAKYAVGRTYTPTYQQSIQRQQLREYKQQREQNIKLAQENVKRQWEAKTGVRYTTNPDQLQYQVRKQPDVGILLPSQLESSKAAQSPSASLTPKPFFTTTDISLTRTGVAVPAYLQPIKQREMTYKEAIKKEYQQFKKTGDVVGFTTNTINLTGKAVSKKSKGVYNRAEYYASRGITPLVSKQFLATPPDQSKIYTDFARKDPLYMASQRVLYGATKKATEKPIRYIAVPAVSGFAFGAGTSALSAIGTRTATTVDVGGKLLAGAYFTSKGVKYASAGSKQARATVIGESLVEFSAFSAGAKLGSLKPLKFPEEGVFYSSQSFKYKTLRSTPFRGRTGRSGGVATKNIIKRDTHLIVRRNVLTSSKPSVSVLRTRGGVQVQLGKKVYTQTRVGEKVTVTKSVIKKGKIFTVSKTTKPTLFGLKSQTFRTKQKLPTIKTYSQSTVTERPKTISALGTGKGLEGRIDTKKRISFQRRDISRLKTQQIYGIQTTTVKQAAVIKASLKTVTKGQNIRVYKGSLEARRTNIFYTKGKYPKLQYGKLKEPIDKSFTDVRYTTTERGTPVENIMFTKIRGSRVIKDIKFSSRQTNIFYVKTSSRIPEYTEQTKQFLIQPLKGKKATLKLKTEKSTTINIGEKLESPSSTIQNDLKFSSFISSNKITRFRFVGGFRAKPTVKPTTIVAKVSITEPITKTRSSTRSIYDSVSKSNIQTRTISQSINRTRSTQQIRTRTQTTQKTIQKSLTKQTLTSFESPKTVSSVLKPPIITNTPSIRRLPFPIFRFKNVVNKRVIKPIKRKEQPKAYTPSAFAIAFGIKGKATKGAIKSGVGIRPIIDDQPKRKKLLGLF